MLVLQDSVIFVHFATFFPWFPVFCLLIIITPILFLTFNVHITFVFRQIIHFFEHPTLSYNPYFFLTEVIGQCSAFYTRTGVLHLLTIVFLFLCFQRSIEATRDFCGENLRPSDSLYVIGSIELRATAVATYGDTLLSAVTMDTVDTHLVALLGTGDGKLRKVRE